MRDSEVFEALYAHEGDKPIRSAVSRLCDLGFGCLDEDLFLRCCEVLHPSLRKKAGVKAGVMAAPPSDATRRTEGALRRGIAAIKEMARIPHWKLLPYRLPLIVLTAFYDRFPQEDSRVDRRVAHWIWRGALTADHRDSSNARIERLVKEIEQAGSASVAVDALLAGFGSDPAQSALQNDPASEIDRDISLKRAASIVFLLALLSAEPQRPARERQLELWDDAFSDGTLDGVEGDAESPASSPEPFVPSKLFFSLTDRPKLGCALVVKLPDVGRDDILSADPDTLRSYLLDPDAVERLNAGDEEGFLARRRSLLTEYFRRFVADRWGDRTDTRPSVHSILEDATT